MLQITARERRRLTSLLGCGEPTRRILSSPGQWAMIPMLLICPLGARGSISSTFLHLAREIHDEHLKPLQSSAIPRRLAGKQNLRLTSLSCAQKISRSAVNESALPHASWFKTVLYSQSKAKGTLSHCTEPSACKKNRVTDGERVIAFVGRSFCGSGAAHAVLCNPLNRGVAPNKHRVKIAASAWAKIAMLVPSAKLC